jgi:hypothetical protein
MEITPPHMHMSFELLFRAGMLPSNTVGAPGTQGAMVMGMQGIGTNTPNAAAVAAATMGLAMDWHMPKGMTLAMGLLSMMLAAGGPPAMTLLMGITINAPGATPKVHFVMAPVHTCCPIPLAPHQFF